jgi:hypothetical protein
MLYIIFNNSKTNDYTKSGFIILLNIINIPFIIWFCAILSQKFNDLNNQIVIEYIKPYIFGYLFTVVIITIISSVHKIIKIKIMIIRIRIKVSKLAIIIIIIKKRIITILTYTCQCRWNLNCR